ncbi:uncharacterized protein LOC120326344 [Styela clava]
MEIKHRDGAHEMYHRIIQPEYERMVIQHVFKNKINLKSGATSQLLQKRPKTTGYLSRKRHFTEVRRLATPHSTSYWKPGTFDQWKWNSKAGSTVLSVKMMQDAHSTVYPRLTDDKNLKASSLSNTFSATTRVREVPVSSIYRREMQEFRCRSPSARGVRSIPLTNRSLVAPPQSVKSSYITVRTMEEHGGRLKGSHQVMRHLVEKERMERTRELKRQAQISEHRMDRMYYMNGAPAKLHEKYDVSEVDLERLQSIAVSQGIKISPSISSFHSRNKLKTTSAPNSSPRDMNSAAGLRSSDVESGTKTIIPTADILSVGGDFVSEDGLSEKLGNMSGREDAATSDYGEDLERGSKVESVEGQSPELKVQEPEHHGNEEVEVIDSYEPQGSNVKVESSHENEEVDNLPNNDDDQQSMKSDSALLSPEALNAPLAVSGAFLTDLTGGD